jgi:hypothetical protein
VPPPCRNEPRSLILVWDNIRKQHASPRFLVYLNNFPPRARKKWTLAKAIKRSYLCPRAIISLSKQETTPTHTEQYIIYQVPEQPTFSVCWRPLADWNLEFILSGPEAGQEMLHRSRTSFRPHCNKVFDLCPPQFLSTP